MMELATGGQQQTAGGLGSRFYLSFTQKLFIAIVLLTIIAVAILAWVRAATETKEYLEYQDERLSALARLIIAEMPGSFEEIIVRHGVQGLDKKAQIKAINRELQPIINRLTRVNDGIGAGVYCRALDSVVAIGPNFTADSLVKLSPDSPYFKIDETGKTVKAKNDQSLTWQGKSTYNIAYPLKDKEEIIGYVWASVKIEDLMQKKHAIYVETFGIGLVMLVVALGIIFLIMRQAQRTIRRFAADIQAEQAQWDYREFPELEPLLVKMNEYIEKINAEHRWTTDILDVIPLGIVAIDDQGKIKYQNHEDKVITGINYYDGDKYMSYYDYVTKLAGRPAHLLSVLRTGRMVEDKRSTIRNIYGQKIDVNIKRYPLTRPDGSIYGAVSICRDIGTELELWESKQKVDFIIEYARLGIMIVDNTGTITMANDFMAMQYKRAKDDLIGRAAEEFGEFLLLETLCNGKEFRNEIIERDLPVGRRRQLCDTAKITDDTGKTVGAVLIVKDLTETETAYKMQQQLSIVADAVGQLVVSIDKDARIDYCNCIFAEHYGVNQAEVIGKSIYAIDVFRQLATVLAETMLTGKGINGRTITLIKDNVTKYFLLNTSAVREAVDDKISGAVAVLTDVTGMREEEARRLHNDKLILLGQLSAEIVHEIRNPLTAIGGIAQLLLMKTEDELISGHLQKIIQEVKRIEEFANGLLGFSRQKEGAFEYVNLNTIIQDCIYLMRKNMETKNISLRSDLAADLPKLYVKVNEIKQVLLNIIQNAIQAMELNGELIITSETVNQEQVLISVRDNGCGIPAENLKYVGTAFFTTKPSGTGLGLNISKKIMEKHGGSLEIESIEGEGTTVKLYLPIPVDMAHEES